MARVLFLILFPCCNLIHYLASSDSVISIAMDGADQGAYGLPYFSQPTKDSTSMYKIRQFVVGAVIHGVGIHLYRHIDRFGRGANVTIEVLHRILEKLHSESDGTCTNIRCLVFYPPNRRDRMSSAKALSPDG